MSVLKDAALLGKLPNKAKLQIVPSSLGSGILEDAWHLWMAPAPRERSDGDELQHVSQ